MIVRSVSLASWRARQQPSHVGPALIAELHRDVEIVGEPIDALPTDPFGFPVTHEGTCPDLPGLHFCGVQFMRVRRSGTMFGMGRDAELVAEAIARARV